MRTMRFLFVLGLSILFIQVSDARKSDKKKYAKIKFTNLEQINAGVMGQRSMGERFNFGTIVREKGQALELKDSVCYENDSMIPLVISGVVASCGCTTTSWETKPLMKGAGQQCIQFKLKIAAHEPNHQVFKRITITANIDGRHNEVQVPIMAKLVSQKDINRGQKRNKNHKEEEKKTDVYEAILDK